MTQALKIDQYTIQMWIDPEKASVLPEDGIQNNKERTLDLSCVTWSYMGRKHANCQSEINPSLLF